MTASELAKSLGERFLGDADTKTRLEILATVSSIIGGYPLNELPWHKSSRIITADLSTCKLIAAEILESKLPASIILSGLSEFQLSKHSQKSNGVFHTDSRLSQFLANGISLQNSKRPKVIDPACGSGMLLCQAALRLRSLGLKNDEILSHCIFGADLSEDSTKAAIISLASMTSNAETIRKLARNILVGDSLERSTSSWKKLSGDGFDYIIANPPWERLRTISHEISKSINPRNHYGDDIAASMRSKIEQSRKAVSEYSEKVTSSAVLQGAGDKDLYKLFLELAIKLRTDGGTLCVLVPAGLIRASSASRLRAELIQSSSTLEYVLFDNRPRYFAIDGRFKFLAVIAKHDVSRKSCRKVSLSQGECIKGEVRAQKPVLIDSANLQVIRPDLTLPEVKDVAEWNLFEKLSSSNMAFGDPKGAWKHKYTREVDMTLGRKDFKEIRRDGYIPLIEGRMIHQFRFGCKAHVSGTGRKAVWRNVWHEDCPTPKPQYFIPPSALPKSRVTCLKSTRAGFCDITGQTNERTVLASIIPPEVICGNKVPTITFLNQELSERLTYAWVGIANSFCFDWLTRLVCTTSLNFFILDSVPIPDATLNPKQIAQIAACVKKHSSNEVGRINGLPQRERATIEAAVLKMYGLTRDEALKLLSTFPQIDKAQPPLPGERKSTITIDLIMAEFHRDDSNRKHFGEHNFRIESAHSRGAKGFVPNQFTK